MKFLRWNFSLRSKRSGESRVRLGTLVVLLAVFLGAPKLHSQEQSPDKPKFEVDLSDLQKEIDKVAAKPYSLGGFVEAQPTLSGVDRDSAFSRVRFFRHPPASISDQHNFRLRLEGSYKHDIFSVFFKTDTQVQKDRKSVV